jgi:hypothetical protein
VPIGLVGLQLYGLLSVFHALFATLGSDILPALNVLSPGKFVLAKVFRARYYAALIVDKELLTPSPFKLGG